jgi:hypothetical protein
MAGDQGTEWGMPEEMSMQWKASGAADPAQWAWGEICRLRQVNAELLRIIDDATEAQAIAAGGLAPLSATYMILTRARKLKGM